MKIVGRITFIKKVAYCLMIASATLLQSCIETVTEATSSVSNSVTGQAPSSGTQSRGTSSGVNNSFDTVSTNYGRYLKDNPIALSNNYNLGASTDLSLYLPSNQIFITSNSTLSESCSSNGSTRSDCFAVKQNNYTDFISNSANKWAFDTKTTNFRQVQAFGNVRDIIERFHTDMAASYNFGNTYSYQSAHPSALFSSTDPAYWFYEDSTLGITGQLTTYSDCNIEDNAFFSPSRLEICLGRLSVADNLYIVSDPTVTYHEVGHAFNQIMLNTRNIASGSSFARDSNLGYHFYDEAGAIGEGLADFYSFYMNHRTHFGEWGLGRFLAASRPMSESDSLHIGGLSETDYGRLSYPEFLTYDPNFPDTDLEDVHYAGQIISHFLVAFTKDIESQCSVSRRVATQKIMHILMETFAELGDQTGDGFDGATEDTVNLNADFAHDWISKVNPINYRSFMQTFSKYYLYGLGNSSVNDCNGTTYGQDRYEALVDSYGLLLFKTYNENGNGITTGHSGTNTNVTDANRIKTKLVQKKYLKLDDRDGKPKAYIIDSQSDIADAINSMKASGQVSSISSQIDSSFAYNNGNGKISPGEVIGLSLSLYNNSNSKMAGVQLLANDWDHTKANAPCNSFEDEWPLTTEGAADLTTETGVEGDCNYVTRYNGDNSTTEPNEELAPVCFVEIRETNSTQWKQQNSLLSEIGLDSSKCLGGSSSTDDCFVRAIDGADQAYYSMINPKSTWAESLGGSTGVPTFNYNNVIFFEINPWIPPGTVFNCRVRARFTNCDDCYHDDGNGDDNYLDYEFSGPDPFKIINFQFTVID